MKYTAKLLVPEYQDLFGWEIQIPGTNGFMEGGVSPELLYHDIFEHWFEMSGLFRTPELSINGEAVAMGIRHSLETNWGLATQHGAYNKFNGWQWNSRATIKDLLYNVEQEECPIYGVCQTPIRASKVEVESWRVEEAAELLQLHDKYPEYADVLAHDYAFGWAWADEVYQWHQQDALSRFMENLKVFHVALGLGDDLHQDNIFGLESMIVNVDLGRADIRATITGKGRVGYVSSNMSEEQARANASRVAGFSVNYW